MFGIELNRTERNRTTFSYYYTTAIAASLVKTKQTAFDTKDYWKTMSVDKKEWNETFAKHHGETLADGGTMDDDVAAAAATVTTASVAAKKEGDSSSTDESSSSKLSGAAAANGEASQKDAKQKNTTGNTNAATATPATATTATTSSSSPVSLLVTSTSVPVKTTNTTKNSSEEEPNEAEVYRIQDKTNPQRNQEHPTASPATTATLVPASPETKEIPVATPKTPPSVTVSTPPPPSSHNSTKAVVTPNAKSVDDNKNNSTTLLTKQNAAAQEVAENLCLVFPSAVSDKTEAIATSTVPFVTLHPVFWGEENHSASMLLRALDGMLQQLLDNNSASFLSPDWFLSAEEAWKKEDNNKSHNKSKKNGSQYAVPSAKKFCRDRLQSLWDTATEQKAPVLLFLVLLVRMEVAVYLSFHQQRHEQQSTAAAAAATTADSTRLHPAQLTKLVESLESLAKSSASLDAAQLKYIISPLVDGGFCSFETDGNKTAPVKDAKLENLLFTPLPVAVQIFSTVQLESDKTIWERWDKAWRATLRNVRDHALPSQHTMTTGHSAKSNNELPAISKVEAETGDNDEGAEWMNSTSTNDPATPATPATNGKRSKRRKKKKVRRFSAVWHGIGCYKENLH